MEKDTAQGYIIRPALPDEALRISLLLAGYAAQKMLLSRSAEEVLENLRDFQVLEHQGEVVGCCALRIYAPDLAEIRSLAVADSHRGTGMGQALVAACEADAARFHIARVFALTYIPDFFRKAGYQRVSKDSLPQKIWRDCFKCDQFPDCKEVAMLKKL